MKTEQKNVKNETVIFRVSSDKVKHLDCLAKLTGANRSEVLRRLIPDLRTAKERTRCAT